MSCISISIPNNNIPERQYVLKFIFDTMLGLEYEILESSSENTIIHYNDKRIEFIDGFFNENKEPLSYLKESSIPTPFHCSNRFTVEKDILVIYGSNQLLIDNNDIVCGIDIFSSIFFMLTRWEEYVNKTRDRYNRFQAHDSIAYKYGFLDRPIVNEYVEMLWNMLLYFGFDGCRKDRKFQLVPTHDIDSLFKNKRFISTLRIILGDIIKRCNPIMAVKHFFELFKPDPYDVFDYLMDKSESIGLQSHFYFMSTDLKISSYEKKNYLNTKKFREVINRIKQRGHIIGFHPGFFSYDNAQIWNEELASLKRHIDIDIKEGRQHFLRVTVPETIRLWNNASFNVDSSLGYADKEGFRCGTGDEFLYFDFLERKELRIVERPLIIMDGTINGYQNLSTEQIETLFSRYVHLGVKYRMPITILFHNSSFSGDRWNGWFDIYNKLISLG